MNIPEGVLIVRRNLCKQCPTPCNQQHNYLHYSKKCSGCPLKQPRWRPYGKCMFGLGDAVAALASPVAAASDSMFGTSLSSCGGCAKRRKALNQMVPNILPPLSP